MEKAIGLKGKSEWAGARKVLAALKRARKIKGAVKLVQNPAGSRRTRGNPAYGSSRYSGDYLEYNRRRVARGQKPVTINTYLGYTLRGRAKKYMGHYVLATERGLERREGVYGQRSAGGGVAYRSVNPRRARNIAGFMSGGVFHPIRSGERMISYKGKRVLVKDEKPYSRRKAGEGKVKRKNPSAELYALQHKKGGRWINISAPVSKDEAREELAGIKAQNKWFDRAEWRITSLDSMRGGGPRNGFRRARRR